VRPPTRAWAPRRRLVAARRHPALAASVLLFAATLVAGCGVPTGDGPTAIPKAQVPFGLLAPEAPTTTSTTVPPSTFSVPVTVFFVSSNRQYLVASPRSVAPPGTLTAVLDVLLAGPSAIDSENGVTTALPVGVHLLDVAVSGGVATVNFNLAFGQISGTQQVLAVAQVVYTVTSQLGPNAGVQFEIAGTAIPVPIASGAQASGPVHLLQYLSLAPQPPPPNPASTVAAGSATTTTTTTTTAGATGTASPVTPST